jgi:hypothetical protein
MTDDPGRVVHEAERAIREQQLLHAATVEELRRQRARVAAQDVLRGEKAAAVVRPPRIRADALLSEPAEPMRYRVDKVWPAHGRVILSAQFKAGKTIMRNNLVRALVDGTSFLDTFTATPIVAGETITIFDNEVGRDMTRAWLLKQNIRNLERIVVNLYRGSAGAMDFTNDRLRARFVDELRSDNTKILIMDCLGPVLAALGMEENSASDVGNFLEGFQALMAEANIDEGMVIHHMGHVGERSRGTTRLRDWPDAEWRMVREHEEGETEGDNSNPAQPRYFSAYGRDVDVSESALIYEPLDMHLSLGTGNRKVNRAKRKDVQQEAEKSDVARIVTAFVTTNPGLSARRIQELLYGVVGRDAIREVLAVALRDGRMRSEDGARGAILHYIADATEEPIKALDTEEKDGNDPLF